MDYDLITVGRRIVATAFSLHAKNLVIIDVKGSCYTTYEYYYAAASFEGIEDFLRSKLLRATAGIDSTHLEIHTINAIVYPGHYPFLSSMDLD